jgi:RimJ/RimL family protein N-acetyltransferase
VFHIEVDFMDLAGIAIRFERTFDYALVHRIVTHPRLYRCVKDDSAPAPEDWKVPEGKHLWWILAYDRGELLGCFFCDPRNAVCWEIHILMLPHAWGERTRRAAGAIAPWIFAHTCARRVVCGIRADNHLALRLARASGFKEYGRNPASWLHEGRLHDQVLLGISKD